MRFGETPPNNSNDMENTSEKPKEVEVDETVSDEANKFSEFSESIEEEKEKMKRETMKEEGISEEEFERREEEMERKAERENLSEDDINKMKIEAAKKSLEDSGDLMNFQEIENLISEGETGKAKREIKDIEYKLHESMLEYKPEFESIRGTYENYNSQNEVAEGARLLLHTEVLNLYRKFSDKTEATKLEVEALKDSARFQRDWKDKSGVVTDCERGLEILERMRGETDGEQAYQSWGDGPSIKNQFEEMKEKAKEEVEK